VARRSYVLDSSAVLTLIENEPGSDRVEQVLRNEAVLLPWLVLLEVYYVTLQERGASEADRRFALMKQFPCEIVWQAQEPTVLIAARFKAEHRISLADSIIAAFAHQRKATLLHKDPEFEPLAGQVDLEALPYKKPGRSDV
jgi:predicted nucleic acid-binding protein